MEKSYCICKEHADGVSHAARITDTGSDSCQIEISGLAGGQSYTFILNGVKPRENGSYGSVKGTFDAPDISGDAMENGSEEDEENEKPEPEKEESGKEPESSAEEQTQTDAETGESGLETSEGIETLPAQTEGTQGA